MSRGPQSAYSFDTRTPSLADVLKAARRTTELELSVSFPATVSKVGVGGKEVSVIPDFKDVVYTETGESTQPAYEIPSLPVFVNGQGAAGGAYLRFAVRVGDKGLVVVSDRSLDKWRVDGRANAPAFYHTHNKIDGVFVPGLRDDSTSVAQDIELATVLEDTKIKLGAGAIEPTALAATLATFLDALVLWANTHTHAFAGPSGTTATGLPTPPSRPNIATTKVFVE